MLGAALGALTLPVSQTSERRQRFDWPGALTFAPTIALFMYMLSRSSEGGWLVNVFLPALVLELGAIFLIIESRSAAPLVDLRLFRQRVFMAALTAGFFVYTLLFGTLFLVPFFLERVWDLNSAQTGLLLTPVPIGLAVAAPISGMIADRGGLRLLTAAGMGSALVGLALLLLLDRNYSAPTLLAALGLVGLGLGLFLPANNSAVMGSAPADRLGVVGGILNMTRGVGAALGVALTGAILTWRLSVEAGQTVTGTLGLRRVVLIVGFQETLAFLALLALLALAISLARGPGASTHRRPPGPEHLS
ncbi:MAG: MFS transporter [Chloroflexi bacterium]|nr:MFS transporter [Chloroflexota bacterium]